MNIQKYSMSRHHPQMTLSSGYVQWELSIKHGMRRFASISEKKVGKSK